MHVTAIKQQVKRAGRYSVYLDGSYSFSLSADALLTSQLTLRQELSDARVAELKRMSDDDKLYGAVLNYLAIRPRSTWEIESYLKRKKASPSLSEIILNKLSNNKLIDDTAFARSFVTSRRLLKPTSRRKLEFELNQKHVPKMIIQAVLIEEETSDSDALQEMIARKRRQTKYQDNMKLMQYLSRQGFNYGDIKDALNQTSD